MQFQVPQNLDIEDRIFGNFSLKQIVYLAGAVGLAYMLFRKLPPFISIPLGLGIIGFGWALAFYPEQKLGRKFEQIVESAVKFYMKDKLYTWKKTPKAKKKAGQNKAVAASSQISVANISDSKLKDLSWSVDATAEGDGNQ